VADAIMAFPGIAEAVVYGVATPGTEGAAGMATLVGNGTIDLTALRKHLAARLPPYARPLFLRIRKDIDVTSTFKHKKSDLAREGFDPAVTFDELYFDDQERQAYVPLDAELHARIVTAKIRL
jgi:fatty-acyl-CoA synthase